MFNDAEGRAKADTHTHKKYVWPARARGAGETHFGEREMGF